MNEPTKDPATSRWHVDRRINISLIDSIAVLFLGQTAVMSRWVGAIEQRVAQLEESEERAADQSATLARLEERIDNSVRLLLRFESRFDVLLSKQEQLK